MLLPTGTPDGNDSGEGGGIVSTNGHSGRGRSAASSSLLSRKRSAADRNNFPRLKQIPPARNQLRQDKIQTSGASDTLTHDH